MKITPNAVERQHLEFSFGKKLCLEEMSMERCVKKLNSTEKQRMEEVMRRFGITSRDSKKLEKETDGTMSFYFVELMPNEKVRPFMPSQEEYDYLNQQLVYRLERANPQFVGKIETKVGWHCEIFSTGVDEKSEKEYREKYDLFITVR